jgi:hypothetical protein
MAHANRSVRVARETVLRTGGVTANVTVLFLPTGPLQDAAIASRWGDRFVELGRIIDAAPPIA